MAGGVDFYRHVYQCDCNHDLRQQTILRRNLRVRHAPPVVAELNVVPSEREELGALLLLVVMHAKIASEAGHFNIDEIIHDISDKLIRRHPHVFGTSDARDSGAVLKQWEAIKREEKKTDSHYLASLPKALPALMRAQKAQSKAARVNFDWTEVRDVVAKVEEELHETKEAIQSQQQERIEEEIGDMLFAVVNLARKCKIDAESALQSATDKFVARFKRLEDELKTRGRKLGDVELAEMDAIWDTIKNDEVQPGSVNR